jgi:adenosylmethionine-8-amino-7-oxononanoate aminotransferase
MQAERLATLAGDVRFANPRQIGTITAIDLQVPDAGYLAEVGTRLARYILEREVLLRPLGNTIYVMPPYCISSADLDLVYAAIADAPDALAGGPS